MRVRGRVRAAIGSVLIAAACSPPPLDTLPADTFAFGVVGDGPYRIWELRRYRRLLADVERADVAWLTHVGDLLWYPCSDEALEDRRARLDALSLPVVYTPGDNEWTDCHERITGGFDPLERLDAVRRIFFPVPGQPLGSGTLDLHTQAHDSTYGEFVENVRWRRGGFVFATLHLVGSDNGTEPFPGRSEAHDGAVERRTEAAFRWMAEAFAHATATGARGVVLALHANPGWDPEYGPRSAFDPFQAELARHARSFDGPILVLHGDSHAARVDRPLVDALGDTVANVTRIETFGSPDIGWLRIVLDSVRGELVAVEPRRMPGWGW